MARLSKLNLSTTLEHVVQRGNNRHIKFFEPDAYSLDLEKLKYCAKELDVKMHVNFLMTHHVRLLATSTQSNAVNDP